MDTQPHYNEDALPEFTPMKWSLGEIRAAIPPHLFHRNTLKGVSYVIRDFALAASFWWAATYIDPTFKGAAAKEYLGEHCAEVCRWAVWCVYWWFQGLTFTGIFVMGHECAHGGLSASRRVCDTLGFISHALLCSPFFSWFFSHHRHHANHASMEKDEVYVPKTRSDLSIPKLPNSSIDWDEHFGDTPFYTLFMLIRQQLFAFPAYLLSNRRAVILSDLGVFAMAWAFTYVTTVWAPREVLMYYGIPWLLLNHWFIMITYLHHTDMKLPHYRRKEWSFQRGAVCTVDRPNFLGWQGRFFLHGIAQYHTIHHFFPQLPFYNGKEATEHLKALIGDHYTSSDEYVFPTLWETYNNCQFVEDEGDIVFYRNKKGESVRKAAVEYR